MTKIMIRLQAPNFVGRQPDRQFLMATEDTEYAIVGSLFRIYSLQGQELRKCVAPLFINEKTLEFLETALEKNGIEQSGVYRFADEEVCIVIDQTWSMTGGYVYRFGVEV